jgi:DNA invertase Pin-like site-specific DNA recombinase
MKKVVAYIRVSTEAQCKEDKFGLDVQKEMITEYCTENDMEVTEWFIEKGVSGAKDDRPEFSKILNGAVGNPPIEAVVVAKNDRIARDVQLYFAYKYQLSRQKLELISVTEDFGQLGVFAPVLEAFIASMAQVERELINTRTSGGRAVKASKGGYSGGRPPFGYRAQNGRLVIVPEEAEVVKEVITAKESGATFQSICDKLNEEGKTNRSGTKFSISTLQVIIENKPLYEGMYRYGKDSEWVKGEHEPILKVE